MADDVNEWDDHADGWDDDPAARAYSRAAFDSLTEPLSSCDISLPGSTVIDFGCGTGLLTERLVAAGASVHAIDTSTRMLSVLQGKVERAGWTGVTTGSIIPPPSPTSDLIVCSSVCSFLDDYPGTVAQLAAHLRPGGLFVQWDWERVDDDPHGLSRDEIVDALTRAGLGRVSVTPAFAERVGDVVMQPLIGWGQRPPQPSTAR